YLVFFFFQAEDGIRDDLVTGVQTCALPICIAQENRRRALPLTSLLRDALPAGARQPVVLGSPIVLGHAPLGRDVAFLFEFQEREIGRASCREWGEVLGVTGSGSGRRGLCGS